MIRNKYFVPLDISFWLKIEKYNNNWVKISKKNQIDENKFEITTFFSNTLRC
jgi:hypothetical protein